MLAKNARLKQINTNTLWDKAYLSLKSALLAGKYAPGERIILRKVAQDLGISLTPVRDAINRLAAENVLDRGGVGQGGGASVPLLNSWEFNQLMLIRIGLEPIAAEASVKNATKSKILNIEKYFNAKIKIVWLLKEGYEEKNGDGGGWNYSEDVGLFPEKYILTRDFY